MKPKATPVKAIRIKVYNSTRVYTTAKAAASAYTEWSSICFRSKQTPWLAYNQAIIDRERRTYRRVKKVFEAWLV